MLLDESDADVVEGELGGDFHASSSTSSDYCGDWGDFEVTRMEAWFPEEVCFEWRAIGDVG